MKITAEEIKKADLVRTKFEDFLDELLYEYHELEVDYYFYTDEYDNSIEICFEEDIEKPWEPHPDIRKAILNLGFYRIFWNFTDGTEIRGNEPRRSSSGPHKYHKKVGYVDEDFDYKEYIKACKTWAYNK